MKVYKFIESFRLENFSINVDFHNGGALPFPWVYSDPSNRKYMSSVCVTIIHYINKDHLSLTNPRDALQHGQRAANNKVGTQCDKLATELS